MAWTQTTPVEPDFTWEKSSGEIDRDTALERAGIAFDPSSGRFVLVIAMKEGLVAWALEGKSFRLVSQTKVSLLRIAVYYDPDLRALSVAAQGFDDRLSVWRLGPEGFSQTFSQPDLAGTLLCAACDPEEHRVILTTDMGRLYAVAGDTVSELPFNQELCWDWLHWPRGLAWDSEGKRMICSGTGVGALRGGKLEPVPGASGVAGHAALALPGAGFLLIETGEEVSAHLLRGTELSQLEPRLPRLDGARMAVDPRSGRILALLGLGSGYVSWGEITLRGRELCFERFGPELGPMEGTMIGGADLLAVVATSVYWEVYRKTHEGWRSVSYVSRTAPSYLPGAVFARSEAGELFAFTAEGELRSMATDGSWAVLARRGGPGERSRAALAWTPEGLVLFGGQRNGKLLDDTWRFQKGKWIALRSKKKPEKRSWARAMWAGDRLLLWGGEGQNDERNLGAWWLQADQWVQACAELPDEPRTSFATSRDGKILELAKKEGGVPLVRSWNGSGWELLAELPPVALPPGWLSHAYELGLDPATGDLVAMASMGSGRPLFTYRLPRPTLPVLSAPIWQAPGRRQARKVEPIEREKEKLDLGEARLTAKRLALSPEEKLKLPSLSDTVRKTYRIKTRSGEDAKAALRFGGSARLERGEAWPACKNCHKPMPLVAEVDLAKVPDSPAKGLVQFFYCNSIDPNCEDDCEAWQKNESSMLLRRLPPSAKLELTDAPALANPLKPKVALELKEARDQPVEDDVRKLFDVHSGKPRTVSADKLWGWPAWVQGPEWSECPECKQRMDLLLQLESNKAAGIQWGDLGCAYLLMCRTHPDQLGFGWQCG